MKELYKVYRPKTLDEVVGNKGAVATLRSFIKRKALPHFILFNGPSGCGKTTLARILRRELACSSSDFQERNCSDYRGIDAIRDTDRNMRLSPIGGKHRVYLWDEVHQITKDAQNAALKMLEDTPSHVYFMFATTDPQKLLPTIRTRATEIEVELLGDDEVKELVKRVAKKENISLRGSSVEALIDHAEGSARTALVLLDKIRDLPSKSHAKVMRKVKEDTSEAIDLYRALSNKSWPSVKKVLNQLKDVEPETVRWSVLGLARWNLLAKGSHQDYVIIKEFENHFYDSKQAGLAAACWGAIHGE